MNNYSENISYENSKNSKNIEEELENDILLHKFNLYQQFFVIGIEPKIVNLLNKIDIKSIPEPILGPKIITKYPNRDLPYLNISDSLIISHCFPKGFVKSIIEYKQYELKEKILQTKDFIFSLDNFQINNNTSLRTNKVYYSCFLFYEKFEDYQNWLKLKNNSKSNNNNFIKKNLLIPKVICLSSFFPYVEESKQILHYLKKNVDNCSYTKYIENNSNYSSVNSNLSIEKIVEGLIYNLPGLPRSNFIMKINKNNFIIEQEPNACDGVDENENEISFFNSPANKKPKPIINYSKLMKFFRIEEIFGIIKYILLEEPILFFSNNIEDLTYTIKGLLSLIYPFEYHYPVVEVLPEQNYTFINIYKCFIFGINQKYSDDFFVLKGVNLDDQKNINVILIENRFNNILNSNEKDKTKITTHIKTNNSKFLIISQKSIDTSISEIKDLYIKKKNMIGEHKEEEKINEKVEEKKIKLPFHYYTKCCKKIENSVESKFKEIKSKIKEKDKKLLTKKLEKEKQKIFNEEIVENFLYFFTSIFLRYQEYCTKFQYAYIEHQYTVSSNTKTGTYFREKELEKKYYMNKLTINDLFNCQLFIDEMPNLDQPFYSKFLKTKIFFNFMKKKIFPMSLQDKLDVLFFDDKVNEKLSRESGMKKIETKFLEHDITNISGNIEVSRLSKSFNDNYKNFIMQEKNKNKIINYFQYLAYENLDKNEKINNSYLTDSYSSTNNNNIIEFKLKFYYFVFPKLLNDNIFYKENKNEEDSSNKWNTTSFTYKNSDCLYNQFEKEGNIIINDENLTKNYYNHYYTLNPHKSYSFPIEYYIKILYLQYFSKTFHQIPYSKKNYYFNYLIHFMLSNKDILDDNSILMMFEAIINYGDKNMAKNFYQFIRNKTYTIFLMLREKTRPDKNFIKFDNSKLKHVIGNDDEKNINIQAKKRRSLSEDNQSIKLSDMFDLRNRKYSKTKGYEEENDIFQNPNYTITIEKKDNVFKINDKFNFTLNLICNEKKDNKPCKYPLDSHFHNYFDENQTYIEIECLKCKNYQKLDLICKYKEDNNKEYKIKTKLYSPLTLLENDWFKNKKKLNLSYITENYLDSYICAIFYFYEQGLLCDFLLPNITEQNNLQIENNNNYSINMEKLSPEEKNVINISSNITSNISNINKNDIEINNNNNNQNHIEINNNVGNDKFVRKASIFDISDQKQSFFEFKSDIKKSCLINNNIRKKNTNTSSKKIVGFTTKNKKAIHKKNNLSYSDFLNK